ncbi:putative cardiolipin synthase YwiE [subsurface metagenome]
MKLIFDEQALYAYLQGIQSAEKTISISCFKFHLPKKEKVLGTRVLLDHLLIAKRRGINIRILIHFRQPRDQVTTANRDVIRELKAAKVNVRSLRNNRMCHAKFMIIDNTIGILGSHNLSMSSLRRNFEASVVFTEDSIIAPLQNKFDDLFRTAQEL